MDDFVRGEMEARHIPGVALAVIKDGKVERVSGYGAANLESNTPVTAKTVFQIQSITKTFTSAAILMLAEEGKLGLDDPISKHLAQTPETWKEITLRHLLSHTSGIKDFINEPTASLRIEVTEAEVLKATAGRPLNFGPGQKYAYSNTNYHLLAMVIRQVTGKSYGEFLGERIFKPLGMSDTRIFTQGELVARRANGYIWQNNSMRNGHFVAESILGYGGGGILSTAEDMAKWALALDGEKVLKRASLEAAWTPMKLKDGSATRYGLGWGVGQTNGRRFVAHNGAHMTGFTSSFTRYYDDGLTVIVLTNARQANPDGMGREIAGKYVAGLGKVEKK